MNNRLLQIIKYKTNGRKQRFGELMGWSSQYLSKLLRGDNFGLQPVLAILKTFPDIDARWLLLGEGQMLTDTARNSLQQLALKRANALLDLERYIPVMDADELKAYAATLTEGATLTLHPLTIAKWEQLVQQREQTVNERFSKAMKEAMD